MNPKLILVFLFLTVLLIGCIGNFPSTENSSSKDPSVCEKENDYGRFNCYVQLADRTNDKTLCEKLPEPDVLGSIGDKEYCYVKFAYLKKDVGICDTDVKSDQYKYMCYRDLAVEKNDSKICEKIDNESRRKQCYDDFKHTVVLVLQPVTNPLEIASLMIKFGDIVPLLSVLSIVLGIIILVVSRQAVKHRRIFEIIGIALLLAGIAGLFFLYVFPSLFVIY